MKLIINVCVHETCNYTFMCEIFKKKKKNSYDTNPKKRDQVMRLVKLILKREINFCLNFKLTQLSDCL